MDPGPWDPRGTNAIALRIPYVDATGITFPKINNKIVLNVIQITYIHHILKYFSIIISIFYGSVYLLTQHVYESLTL